MGYDAKRPRGVSLSATSMGGYSNGGTRRRSIAGLGGRSSDARLRWNRREATVRRALAGEARSDIIGLAPMKSVLIHRYGGPDVLSIEEIPEPAAGPGEILVEVHAAGLNPIDFKIRDGKLKLLRKL